MKQFLEGSFAMAQAAKLCRPGVIAAYPITPQTHIVENLSQFIADGELDAKSVNVESEHSAASCVLGSQAAGVRSFTLYCRNAAASNAGLCQPGTFSADKHLE
jgi:pyruvate ferredoxin oxidoreductase alpha subunit